MTKQDLIKEVARDTGVPATEVQPIVEATIASIKGFVQDGEAVYLRGFGTFKPKHRAEKKARNITTGAAVIVAAHEIAHFKPSKSFTIKK